jgi:demethylmenaquinone methyltransferase/2-methoxy-6-polyprenyl-1,4-benzoquinol methylase
MASAPESPRPDEHGRGVSMMFGRIAGWYDFLNHFLSLGLDIVWRKALVRELDHGETGRVLDLAAGTLDVSREILRQHPGWRVIGADFSLPMLQRGKQKLDSPQGLAIWPVLADGRRLPLKDGCVDGVTIAFGIRNILPRETAFAEMLRVLRPGGRLCVLEFGSAKKRIWGGLYNQYLGKLLPVIGKIFSGDAQAYRYLAETIKAFPTAPELGLEMEQAGFDKVYYRPLLSGVVWLHVGEKKARP